MEGSERGQVETRAYQLVPFLRYLSGARSSEPAAPIDFWSLTWDDLRRYKSDLLCQVRASFRTDDAHATQNGARPITHETADRYLFAAYSLFSWWAEGPLTGRILEKTRRAQGAFSHLKVTYEVRPEEFTIKTPRKYRQRRKRGLPLDIYNEVWHFLETSLPPCPPILEADALTPRLRRVQQRAERSYDLQMLRYHRNKALWAFLLATGFRVGEVVRVRQTDFTQNIRTGGLYVELRDRAADAHLSDVKGPFGQVFIGHTPRFLRHIQEWRDVGTRYAALRRQVTGAAEHEMLFANDDGSPLTVGGVESFIDKIDRAVRIRARGYRFSPHVTRHTIGTILRSGNVDLVYRQWFFRHRQPETTEGYGSLFEQALGKAIAGYEKEPTP
jgi:integrase